MSKRSSSQAALVSPSNLRARTAASASSAAGGGAGGDDDEAGDEAAGPAFFGLDALSAKYLEADLIDNDTEDVPKAQLEAFANLSRS